MQNMGRIAGLLLVFGMVGACSGPKANCSVNTDCGNGQFCAPAGCTWGCFREGVGCREGGWCHPESGQCLSELPALSDFKATPSVVGSGGSSTLEWTVLGADTLTIEPGTVDVTGMSATVVNPDVTTVYTLTATNAFGTVSATVKVDVTILKCDKESDCTAAKLTCNIEWGICVVGSCAGRADFTPCNLVPTDGSLNLSYDICVDGICISPGTCGNESCNVPGPHFPLADTGQRECFASFVQPCDGQDAKYGWDASHPDNNERFTRDDITKPSEPVVVDHVTGLTWQDGFTLKETDWPTAFLDCDQLEWGGFSDWRLPDPYELHSIVDLSAFSPAIDEDFFLSMPTSSATFWTSSSKGTRPWIFDFLKGTSSYYYTDTNIIRYARCVRSEPAGISATRFTRSSGDTPVVEDSSTKLVWQGCIAGREGSECGNTVALSSCTDEKCTWKEALAYCEASEWAGDKDWRLPNTKELMSIVDYRRSLDPAIDTGAFRGMPEKAFFWSSSSYDESNFNPFSSTDNGTSAWTVYFGDGHVGYGDKDGTIYVRCVRGGS